MDLVMFIVVISVLISASFLARYCDLSDSGACRGFRILWGLVIVGLPVYTLVSVIFMYQQTGEASNDELVRWALAGGLAIFAAPYLWVTVFSRTLRQHVARLLNRPATADPFGAIPGGHRGFDPQRITHAYALGLVQLLLVQTLIEFLVVGGQSGLVNSGLLEQDVVTAAAVSAAMLILVTLAGVGFMNDRNWRQVAERLGLTRPTISHLSWGITVAGLLLAFQFCAGTVWTLLVPVETFEQQTQLSQAIANSVTTLSAAFLVALFSSIGEELAFRGALQPVLGLWPTAIFFALTHIQYQFTPAVLIILVVGLAFGWVRKHHGTIAAVVAHFGYNFALLVLAWLASQLPPVS
ncbi:MAG: hypothetical protein Kow0077_07800 [Anaerolineae bacterium]